MRCALRYVDCAFRNVAMAAAKSGEVTVASGVPWRTNAPGLTRILVIGPETGASTCVERSPLNATVPVVWSDVRKGAKLTAATRIFACCCGVSVTSTAWPDESDATATVVVSVLMRLEGSREQASAMADEASATTRARRGGRLM